MRYELISNVLIIIFFLGLIFGVVKIIHFIQDEEEKRYKGNNYTLVNYTANGDTLAIYNNVKDYRFQQPSIIIRFEVRFEDGKK